MINSEIFSHVYFATPTKLRSCAYLDSLGKFDFRSKMGFKIICRARARLGLVISGWIRASKWGPFTTLDAAKL